MQYEIGLVNMYDGPAKEKRGPFETRELALAALEVANKELYGRGVVSTHRYPQWMWAREGEIKLVK